LKNAAPLSIALFACRNAEGAPTTMDMDRRQGEIRKGQKR
jgi:hypothetical protein